MSQKLFILISTVAGITLFVLVFYLFNIARVFSHMIQIGSLGVGVFLLNVFLIILVGGISWYIILKAYGHHLPFRDVLIIKIIGIAISYLTPSMYIGGEPMRIYLLGKKHGVAMTRIGATVVVDKFLELGAGLFYIFLGSIYTLVYYELPFQIFAVLVGINAIFLTLAFLFLISFIFRTRAFSKILLFIARFKPLKKPLRAAFPFIKKMESDVFSAFGKHRKSTLQAFILNLIVGGFVFIKPAIFFYFLHTLFSLSQLSLLYALTHLILAFQFTPGALGIFEWGEVGIFSLIGVESEKALAYTLMVRIADLIVVAFATVTAFHMGVRYLGGKRKNEGVCGV